MPPPPADPPPPDAPVADRGPSSDDPREAPDVPDRPWWWRWGRRGAEAVLLLGALAVVMHLLGWLRAPALPDAAPDFALPDLDGQIVRLSDLRGQPVVVNFWATWCGPCRLEAPAFSRFQDSHPDVVVLGIAADGPAPKLRRVGEELGITYRILQGDPSVLRDYEVSVFPTTVVVDPSGAVHSAHAGLLLDPQILLLTAGLD